MDVVVVIEGVEKVGHFLASALGKLREILGHITHLGGDDCPPCGFERLGDGVQILHLGQKPRPLATLRNLLRLQRLNRVPDLATNTVVQHDNSTGNNQFNLQLGLPLPVWDRNQGNIRAAESQIASNTAALAATENDLTSRLADAMGRYEANLVAVANYRDKVLPAMAQAYQGLISRYQQEPVDVPGGKVAFNDIVTAQQNLAQALQSYLAALTAQWQAVVDLGSLLQVDELYSGPPEK